MRNKYWFKPKSFGLGAEPTTWEGWLLIAAFVAYMVLLSLYLVPNYMGEFYLYFTIGMLLLIYITKKKTDGPWEWNWGKKK
tara:strand:+ start:31 stop:273 length:243 start_codon:yes stop_codon:yes gene_type:complete